LLFKHGHSAYLLNIIKIWIIFNYRWVVFFYISQCYLFFWKICFLHNKCFKLLIVFVFCWFQTPYIWITFYILINCKSSQRCKIGSCPALFTVKSCFVKNTHIYNQNMIKAKNISAPRLIYLFNVMIIVYWLDVNLTHFLSKSFYHTICLNNVMLRDQL